MRGREENGRLLVSDRELRKAPGPQPLTKGQALTVQLPVMRRELGRGEEVGERRRGGRKTTAGVGVGTGRKLKEVGTEREQTQTRRVTCPSKTKWRHMQRRSMKTASEERPAPPNGLAATAPGEASASRRASRAPTAQHQQV